MTDTAVRRCHYVCTAHHGVDNHAPECDPGAPPETAVVCEPCQRDAAGPEPYQDETLAREYAARTMEARARVIYRADVAAQYRDDPRLAHFSYDRLDALEARVKELAKTAGATYSWPDDHETADPGVLLADARAVAGLCRDILAESPEGLEALFGQAWAELPDWFTGRNNGRALWRTEGTRAS